MNCRPRRSSQAPGLAAERLTSYAISERMGACDPGCIGLHAQQTGHGADRERFIIGCGLDDEDWIAVVPEVRGHGRASGTLHALSGFFGGTGAGGVGRGSPLGPALDGEAREPGSSSPERARVVASGRRSPGGAFNPEATWSPSLLYERQYQLYGLL
jgi:hypothetical protein